jgi:hypothetical protein
LAKSRAESKSEEELAGGDINRNVC